MYILLFLLFACNVSAMAPDGVHVHDDYVALSYESPDFDAACAVMDTRKNVSMTGVLVAPDVVLTAAHGIEAIFRDLPQRIEQGFAEIAVKNMVVSFRGKDTITTVPVRRVLVDRRYFEGHDYANREGKFDFAFLKLAAPLHTIVPARVFNKETVSDDALMTVVTYGVVDLKARGDTLVRRAFRLYERDTYFGNPKDPDVLNKSRFLQESSVYFKPTNRLSRPEETDSEEDVRSFDATQNWIKDGKKPYALGLPGTSGSPVFIQLIKNGQKKWYLFGVVSSFSHLSGIFHGRGSHEADYILTHHKESLGNYQTIYSLVYQNIQYEQHLPHTKIYAYDPQIMHALMQIMSQSQREWGCQGDAEGRVEVRLVASQKSFMDYCVEPFNKIKDFFNFLYTSLLYCVVIYKEYF